MFDGFDFSGFWDESDYALDEYTSEPPSDTLIVKIEHELGYKLPESYIWLMKNQRNGGVPIRNYIKTNKGTSWSAGGAAIDAIYGIGYDKDFSLCGGLGSQFMIDEWGYPDIGVAICSTPSAGHDMVFLDYRECGREGEPKVVHIDQEFDYKITPLADSFEQFIMNLVEPDCDSDPDETEHSDEEPTTERKKKSLFGWLFGKR